MEVMFATKLPTVIENEPSKPKKSPYLTLMFELLANLTKNGRFVLDSSSEATSSKKISSSSKVYYWTSQYL